MIQVRDISKKFLIPHEKRVTLREHVLGFLLGRTMGFEPLHALRGISFDVHKGEFFSIFVRYFGAKFFFQGHNQFDRDRQDYTGSDGEELGDSKRWWNGQRRANVNDDR